MAVKANTAVAGLCMNLASRFLTEHRPTHSAYLVRRLRDAGFIVVGTTNLSEFGILPTTEPRHSGPTRNPWELDHTPGGSSGGAAAAVAAGLVPVAHGNDGGGSLRIPAACCGLVGLKPSRGRISRGPDLGDSFLGADGVLTRSVIETALLLDVLAGYEAATRPGRRGRPSPTAWRCAAIRGGCGSRSASRTRSGSRPIRSPCARCTRPARRCASSATTSPRRPRAPGRRVARAVPAGLQPAGRARHPPRRAAARPAAGGGRDRAGVARGARHRGELPATGYLTAVAQLQLLARGTVAFFADYDVLLTPVLASRPLRIGELHGCGDDPLEDLTRSGTFAPYTPLFNVTGQPALSLPMGFGEDGLPCAVQLVGRPLAEDTLLQVAAQLEAARPWAAYCPPTFARA